METTPWPDFQTKAFREFAARGDGLRHGGRRFAVAGRGLHRRSLRRSDRVLQEARRGREHGAGDCHGLCRIPEGQRQVLGCAAGRRCDRLGLPQGLVRRPQGNGRVQGEVRLRPGGAQDLDATARHRRVLPSPRREALRRRHLHRQQLRRAGDGRTRTCSSATAANWAITRPTRSRASSTARRRRCAEVLQGAVQVHAAGLGQDLLHGGQPGDHRRPGGDEHELLRLLPGADQSGDQQARQGHRLLRQSRRAPPASASRRWAARASRSSSTRRSRPSR